MANPEENISMRQQLQPHRQPGPGERDTTFQHTSLDLKTDSIRLIQVVNGAPQDVIRCRIRRASTSDRYTCLSYVWGSPKDTELIEIDGKPFLIRRNLWDFLSTVRSNKDVGIEKALGNGSDRPYHDGDLFWIDALCIDQSDGLERNHQVQQMGKIYSGAQRVLAWLGLRPQLASLLRYMRVDMPNQIFFDADHFIALNGLSQNIYWKRAWITQEIQLARQAYLVAGEQYLSLPVLQEQAPKIVARTFSDFICNDLWRPIDHTLQKHEGSSLLDNLYRFRDNQCSDELDICLFNLLHLDRWHKISGAIWNLSSSAGS